MTDTVWPRQATAGEGHDDVDEDDYCQCDAYSHLHVFPPEKYFIYVRFVFTFRFPPEKWEARYKKLLANRTWARSAFFFTTF